MGVRVDIFVKINWKKVIRLYINLLEAKNYNHSHNFLHIQNHFHCIHLYTTKSKEFLNIITLT